MPCVSAETDCVEILVGNYGGTVERYDEAGNLLSPIPLAAGGITDVYVVP